MSTSTGKCESKSTEKFLGSLLSIFVSKNRRHFTEAVKCSQFKKQTNKPADINTATFLVYKATMPKTDNGKHNKVILCALQSPSVMD